MAEVDTFNCDQVRADFSIAELGLRVLPGLVRSEKVGTATASAMARVAEANKAQAVEAAKNADHSGCLGEKACQLAFQSELVVLKAA